MGRFYESLKKTVIRKAGQKPKKEKTPQEERVDQIRKAQSITKKELKEAARLYDQAASFNREASFYQTALESIELKGNAQGSSNTAEGKRDQEKSKYEEKKLAES